MCIKTKKRLMRISVLAVLFVLVLTMFLGKPVVHAAEYTSYDTTDIESDLADIDTVLYPKNEKARHRLLDEVGFMEYSYSESVFIADNYYGLYFYVYNPTEKPVSLADGAHHINMATAYDENGEPTDYANCEITFLDATANNRFLKFKLSDSRAAYDTAVEYAAKHDGARRYDIASIQLLFSGDSHATDSFAGVDGQEGISFTYYCTGYSSGCGADPEAESTLDIQYKKLDTIALDIQSAWYRTDVISEDNDGFETSYTLSSVYFGIPDSYITEYGALQIVKAEWYEYKTTPILVTDNADIVNGLTPYLGYTLPAPVDDPWNVPYDENIPVSFYHYIGPSDSGQQGFGWNKKKSIDPLSRYDWLIETDNIEATVPNEKVQYWAEHYPINEGDEVLTVDGRNYNANLFSDEIDEGHVRGYNSKVFDARDESQWIDLKLENQTGWWESFWNQFVPPESRDEEWLTAENVKPIELITSDRISGNDSTVMNDILVDSTQLTDLRTYVETEEGKGNSVYILRFSLSEYNAITLDYDDGGFHLSYPQFYAATDTVYLAFDIIYLGFVRGDEVTIIPVVADPVDIYPALTPTEDLTQFEWWKLILAIIILIILMPILPYIFKVKRILKVLLVLLIMVVIGYFIYTGFQI